MEIRICSILGDFLEFKKQIHSQALQEPLVTQALLSLSQVELPRNLINSFLLELQFELACQLPSFLEKTFET